MQAFLCLRLPVKMSHRQLILHFLGLECKRATEMPEIAGSHLSASAKHTVAEGAVSCYNLDWYYSFDSC